MTDRIARTGQMGIILKSAHGDCTNGGVTGGTRTQAYIANLPGKVFGDPHADDGIACLILIDHPAGDRFDPILVPCTPDGEQLRKAGSVGRPMFGGNTVQLTDGREIRVHDRFETPAEYEALSR